MGLFGGHGTLKHMDEILQQELQDVDIISDLNLTAEDFNLLSDKINAFAKHGHIIMLYTEYRVAMTVFLVFCAVYHFDDNYWPHVEKYIGEIDNYKYNIISSFNSVLKEYDLPSFEQEAREGYRYVTPILCHAGIPINSMDILFDVLEDMLYNISFFNGYILDEFNYIAAYRANMPIRRYIKYLGDDAEEFLLNLREFMLAVENKEISKEESFTMFPSIQPRFIERYFIWRELPRATKVNARRGRVLFANPKLKIDITGMGIYIVLPAQRINDTYEDKVEWQLLYGNGAQNSHVTIADLYRKDGAIVSEEKIMPVGPSPVYTINLYLEGELINNWEFKGIKDDSDYICFNKNNELIKTDYLPKQSITLVCTDDLCIYNSGITIIEIPPLTRWHGFKFYRVDLEGANILSLYSENRIDERIDIDVRVNKKPSLVGGRLIFNEDPDENLSNNSYVELPAVSIYREKNMSLESQCELWTFSIENKQKNDISTISLSDVGTIKEYDDMILIPLDNPRLIKKGNYGDYTIKLVGRHGQRGRFYLRYIPEIEIYIEPDAFWPYGTVGYKLKHFYCHHPSYVDLDFDNATFEYKEIINGREYSKFQILDDSYILYGKIVINSRYKVPDINFRTYIRPIYWGWMGLDGRGSITWSNKCHIMSLADIETENDVFLIVGMGIGSWESLKIHLKLVDGNRMIYQDEVLKIGKGDIVSVSMNRYLTTIQDNECDSSYLIMDICPDNMDTMTQVVIAKIQDEIVYRNMEVKNEADRLLVTWDEGGSRADRELVIYNYYMPWYPPETIYIEDGVMEKGIDLDELALPSPGRYGIKLRRISGDDFFDDITSVDIPKISDLKSFTVDHLEYANLEPLDALLQYMLLCADNEALKNKTIHLPKHLPDDIDKSDIYKISISYLFFRKNPPRDGKIRRKVKNLFTSMFYKYSRIICKYTILKLLIYGNFSREDFEHLVLKWDIINAPVDTKVTFSINETQYLWDTMPILGFLVDIRTNPADKMGAANRICEWIGQMNTCKLIGKQLSNGDCILEGNNKKPLRGCLKASIWEGCSCNRVGIRLDTDLLGDKFHIDKYFHTLQQSNKFMYLSDDDIYAEYEKTEKDTELKIFGKTYLKTFLDLKKSIKDSKWQSITKNFKALYGKSNIYRSVLKELDDRVEIIKMLSYRRDVEDRAAEYCGLTAYFSSLSAWEGISTDICFYLLTIISYKNMKELFIRDYIIFELYHSIGGEIKDEDIVKSHRNHKRY